MAVTAAESDAVVAERAKESLRMIRSGVAEEVQLIEDLLDVVRFTAGKLRMNMAPVEVHKAVQKVLLSCRESASEKQIDLESDLGATATSVKGDAARLQQVFWNLLCNAIKFTPEGGHIKVRSFNSPAECIAIEMRDSGIGISEEKLPYIFNMFEQGGTEVTARFGGLGLGLTICRGIVEAHGGNIAASSGGDGQGTTFVVRLPLMTQSAQSAGSRDSKHVGVPMHG
jgi:signal transduction histidine kinase